LIEVLDQFRREMVDLEGTIIDVDDLQVGSSGLNSPLTILEALSRIGLVEKGRKEIPLTRNSMISLSSAYRGKTEHHGTIRRMLRYIAENPNDWIVRDIKRHRDRIHDLIAAVSDDECDRFCLQVDCFL